MFPFLLFSFFRSFFLSLNPFSFFIVFFFIAPDFFPKLFNFFLRRRLFDFDGLFSHLPVKFLHISLKHLILPVEFRPFFKSSKFLCLDLHFLFYSFFCRCYVSFILYFVFFLTFRPFLIFTLIPFDKSSSIGISPLKASISFWTLRFQAGCLWLVLFLFFFFIPHLSVIAFAVEYINSFNVVMSLA